MPQVVSNYTTEFGLFGITIAVIGWLLSAAVIVVASTAIGAEFDATEGGWIGRLKVSLGLLDPVSLRRRRASTRTTCARCSGWSPTG